MCHDRATASRASRTDGEEVVGAGHETLRNDSGESIAVAHQPRGVGHDGRAGGSMGGTCGDPLAVPGVRAGVAVSRSRGRAGMTPPRYVSVPDVPPRAPHRLRPLSHHAGDDHAARDQQRRCRGLNSRIMSIKRKAGGFRNPSNFTTAIYFHCGGLADPGRGSIRIFLIPQFLNSSIP
jgi:hypothetical protein